MAKNNESLEGLVIEDLQDVRILKFGLLMP